jgi:hypothetical protein
MARFIWENNRSGCRRDGRATIDRLAGTGKYLFPSRPTARCPKPQRPYRWDFGEQFRALAKGAGIQNVRIEVDLDGYAAGLADASTVYFPYLSSGPRGSHQYRVCLLFSKIHPRRSVGRFLACGLAEHEQLMKTIRHVAHRPLDQREVIGLKQ